MPNRSETLFRVGQSIVHIIVKCCEEDSGLDAVFAALANPHRREIVDLLALQPASIQQLATRVGMSLTAIHRHIGVLESSGLIRRKKAGRSNFLAINRVALQKIQAWAGQYRADWGSDDESLENYVASMQKEKDR